MSRRPWSLNNAGEKAAGKLDKIQPFLIEKVLLWFFCVCGFDPQQRSIK